HELDVEAVGEREEPFGEGREPGFVRLAQRDGEHEPARRRAACGEIGEVHRERLVPEAAGIGAGEEVAPLEEHVGGEDELASGRRCDPGAVVADALERPPRRAREVPPDELELVQLPRLAFATSSGRGAAATRSGTPFTKRWPSLAPKLLPSSTASLMTTLKGVSGCARSSKAPMYRMARSTGESRSKGRSMWRAIRSLSASSSSRTPRTIDSASAWSE